MHRSFFSQMIEPLYTLLIKHDYLYVDPDFCKVSTRRIDDTYRTYSETIALKYPGYELDRSGRLMNKTDLVVRMDELLQLLRSKDIFRYESQKHLFFGEQARFTTGNSDEQMRVVYATYPRSGNSLMRKYFENVTGTATGSDMVIKHSPNLAL